MSYYGSRFYNPSTGRFITADTFSGHLVDPQSLNKYIYVKNNPLKYIDPDGHEYIVYNDLNVRTNGFASKWINILIKNIPEVRETLTSKDFTVRIMTPPSQEILDKVKSAGVEVVAATKGNIKDPIEIDPDLPKANAFIVIRTKYLGDNAQVAAAILYELVHALGFKEGIPDYILSDSVTTKEGFERREKIIEKVMEYAKILLDERAITQEEYQEIENKFIVTVDVTPKTEDKTETPQKNQMDEK